MFHLSSISYVRPILILVFFTLAATVASSQSVGESANIAITFNKTSSLIFTTSITAVDRGSRDLLVQKVKGVDNVLQLKAARTNFKETNLTVITADGKLHHFIVYYADNPSELTIQAEAATKEEDSPVAYRLIFQNEMTIEEMEEMAEAILSSPRRYAMKKASKFDMRLTIQGIYIHDNVMFYHMKISNRSNIPYQTEMLRFFIEDSRKMKRTASQELTIIPLYYHGNVTNIGGKSTEDIVCVLPKFTIPDAKTLSIELMEKNGGRHLGLTIKNKAVVNAQPVRTE